MPARRQSGVTVDGSAASYPSSEGKRSKDSKEKESFGCPFPGCGQSYSRMEYLKRHQRKHQDVRPFQCRDCSKAFARSDVLLRHRRRCHPTPPPENRSSHSPPAPQRGYPGVPISSSRTDAHERSPFRESHKHPRQSSGSSHGREANRPRVEEEEEDEDEENFGESSRFDRQNGMGNGGVYGVTEYPYQTDPVESSTYTPHLLPMFQQQPPFHNMNNPDHLEDASVLLSMAYPGGFPNNGDGSSTQAQQAVPDVPDWAGGQTINMMMEASDQAQNQANVERDRSGSAQSQLITPVPVGDDTLSEAMGNFLGAMIWPGVNKDGNTPGEGALNWTNSPKAQSLFPLSSLFSPSAFGISALPNGNTNGDNEDENNQAVMSILDQLAMYDAPQTRVNPNPERPLLRVDKEAISIKSGAEIARSSRFYLPAERFAGCYQVPHWALPPLRTLSVMASRTFHTVLNHFSFVHTPTFRLIDTAACLAFAICTVGGIRSGKQKDNHLHYATYPPALKATGDGSGLDGPVLPCQTWESLYKANFQGHGDEDEAKVAGWENGPIVRNEKTNMLVKSFSLAQGVMMTEYNVALLQALILYLAPYFLSEDQSERSMANMFLGTIVNIARQIGFFTADLEHFEPKIQIPETFHTPNELDISWRRWIQLETRRRTAYLVYHLDTVCALESNIPCILTPCEIASIPLPAPDTLWKAESPKDWYKAVKAYRPMTLDEAMRRTFFLPTYGAFDTLHEQSETKYYNLLNESDYGPFARVIMIMTLLRGLMDIGEGKRDRGDWRDLTDLWMGCTWLRPGKKILDGDGNDLGMVTRDSLRERFALGLQRWREGFDFDSLCATPTTLYQNSNSVNSAAVTPELQANNSNSPSSTGSSNGKSDGTPYYCEEALPFYWLAQALLNTLKQAPPYEPGWNAFGSEKVQYGEMLKAARLFTRKGEGTGVVPCVDLEVGTGNGDGGGGGGGGIFGELGSGMDGLGVEGDWDFSMFGLGAGV